LKVGPAPHNQVGAPAIPFGGGANKQRLAHGRLSLVFAIRTIGGNGRSDRDQNGAEEGDASHVGCDGRRFGTIAPA